MDRASLVSLLSKAADLGARRDYGGAARILEQVLTFPDAPDEALLHLGRAYHALGQYARAIHVLQAFQALHPSSFAALLYLGRAYLAAGIFVRAHHFLKRALERRPNDPNALGLLATTCLKARRSSLAVEYFGRAVEVAPENKRIYHGYLNALLVRGINLARTGQDDLALQMLEFVVQNGLEATLPYLELGRLHRQRQNDRAALDCYIAAARLEPRDPGIRWHLASLYFSLGSPENAENELSNIRALGGEVPELELSSSLLDQEIIRSCFENSDFRGTLEACLHWLRSHRSSSPEQKPQEAGIHAILAEALRRLGKVDKALEHSARALQLDPSSIELRELRAQILWECGDFPTLRRELELIDSAAPNSSMLLRLRALLTAQTEVDDRLAIERLQAALRAAGPDPELCILLADKYLAVGLPELARGWYRRTADLKEDCEKAYLGEIACAQELHRLGDIPAKELSLSYAAYLERWRERLAIKREYALHLVKSADFRTATQELEALLSWDSQNQSLRRTLAYCYRRVGEHRRAALLLRTILKDHPRDLSALLAFASSLYQAGAKDYAVQTLRKAQPLFPKSAEISIMLADMLIRSGTKEEALDALRESMTRKPADPRPYRRMAEIYAHGGIHEMADRYTKEAEKRERKGGKC